MSNTILIPGAFRELEEILAQSRVNLSNFKKLVKACSETSRVCLFSLAKFKSCLCIDVFRNVEISGN